MLIAAGFIAGIIIGLGVASIIHYRIYKQYHYICPKCSKTFKPSSFIRSMFALNGGDYRKVECIYCHSKEWAKAEKDIMIQ